MNQRERVLLGKVYGQLNHMTGLRPGNPADTIAVSINLNTSVKMARDLAAAVEHLMHGELDIATDYVNDAQADSEQGRAQYERDKRAAGERWSRRA